MDFINLKSDTVVTFNGKKIPRKSARKLLGRYYEENVTCFRIENSNGNKQWYRIDSPKIGFNYDTGTYDLIERMLENGLQKGVVPDKEEQVFFTPNPLKSVYLSESRSASPLENCLCYDSETAEKLGYIECLHSQVWYKKINLSPTDLQKLKEKRKLDYSKQQIQIDYNANAANTTFHKIIDAHRKYSPLIEVEDSTKIMAEFLGKHSFGIEFETTTGTVPVDMLGPLGLLPVRDGSITGYEYTTVPLSGAVGLQTLKNICRELSKRCETGYKCSMHVHLGNITRTKEFVVAMYMLAFKIQKEMFEMFPLYKLNQVKYLGSPKNYCEKLPNLNMGNNEIFSNSKLDKAQLNAHFNELFFFLSGNTTKESPDFNFNRYSHPQDQDGHHKWNRSARYRWLNLLPTVFDRSETVEHRLHTGTLNFTKTSNWLFICLAMVKFCEKHYQEIISRYIKYDLETIIDGYKTNFGDSETAAGARIADYLNAYVKYRKKIMQEAEKRGDAIVESEFIEDAAFKFEHEGMEFLY